MTIHATRCVAFHNGTASTVTTLLYHGSLYLVKAALFSVYVLVGDQDSALLWAADLHRSAAQLTGPAGVETVLWQDTLASLPSYFQDRESLELSVKSWSLEI